MADAQLKITDSHGSRTVQIDKPVFVIGRHRAADLYVGDAVVSRTHAHIIHTEQYVLRDCTSRSGTFVNGEAVTERLLVDGDRIRLGSADAEEIVFVGPAPEAAEGDLTSSVLDFRQVAGLLDGLRALGSGRVLEDVLTLVTDSALAVTGASRGFVMLENGAGELNFEVARSRAGRPLSQENFKTSHKIPRRVFESGESWFIGDLAGDEIAASHEDTLAAGIRQVLCVPLVVARHLHGADESVERRVIGVLYLDSYDSRGLLPKGTRSSLETFAMQAALAIESAHLYTEVAEKGLLERDLRIAAEIQRGLLPPSRFDGPAFELAAAASPCRIVGGDFFDYLHLPEGRFGFALADVAGKGSSAALLAAAVQSIFTAHASLGGGPAEAMASIDRGLRRRAIEARFATMFFAVLSPDGVMRYSNAGHEPALLVRASGQQQWLDAGGPVLGLLPDAAYSDEAIQLESGDVLLVYSDGLTDAQNTKGEDLGRARLPALLDNVTGLRAHETLEQLLAAVQSFTAHAPQTDDLTILVLRYVGSRGA